MLINLYHLKRLILCVIQLTFFVNTVVLYCNSIVLNDLIKNLYFYLPKMNKLVTHLNQYLKL